MGDVWWQGKHPLAWYLQVLELRIFLEGEVDMIYDSSLFSFIYLFSYLSVSCFRFNLRHPEDTFFLKLFCDHLWTCSGLCDSKIMLFTVHFVFRIAFLIP